MFTKIIQLYYILNTMKNFPINYNGKEYWISRAVAVSGFIFCLDNGLRILACKRGKGCPDYQGYWNVPSGYLDFDETLVECASREITEETNLHVNPSDLRFYNFHDSPSNNKQNISFNYWTFDENLYKGQTIYPKGEEQDEVEDVAWIGIDELDNYEWAFNQKYTIRSIVLDYLKRYIPLELRDKLDTMQNI